MLAMIKHSRVFVKTIVDYTKSFYGTLINLLNFWRIAHKLYKRKTIYVIRAINKIK